jgi:hypothetical protein
MFNRVPLCFEGIALHFHLPHLIDEDNSPHGFCFPGWYIDDLIFVSILLRRPAISKS